jgi:hypothetical protein
MSNFRFFRRANAMRTRVFGEARAWRFFSDNRRQSADQLCLPSRQRVGLLVQQTGTRRHAWSVHLLVSETIGVLKADGSLARA